MRRSSLPSLSPAIVGANVDTFIGSVRVNGDFPDELTAHPEELKRQRQKVEEDLPTPWQFAGAVFFIRSHGAGQQWSAH